MPDDWSIDEVNAIVADYLVMLEHELRGESYNKTEHNRHLQKLLRERSRAAIEFKHANISAVLIALGYPYIDGYKPRGNFQSLLLEAVSERLKGAEGLASATEFVVDAPVSLQASARPLSEILVPAPYRSLRGDRISEALVNPPLPRLSVNYLELEARNASLGAAGEAFVLDFEHRRLWEAGKRELARRIEHVSRTTGDGLGYDVTSYEENGRERLIEVKTTSFGSMTPFFASRCEVSVSEERAPHYSLYRVFRFREEPQIFILPGSLKLSCTLDAVQYKAFLA